MLMMPVGNAMPISPRSALPMSPRRSLREAQFANQGHSSPRSHAPSLPFGWTGAGPNAGITRMTSSPAQFCPPQVMRSASAAVSSSQVVRSPSGSQRSPPEAASAQVRTSRSPSPSPMVPSGQQSPTPRLASACRLALSQGQSLGTSRPIQNGSSVQLPFRQPVSTCERASASMFGRRTSSSSCDGVHPTISPPMHTQLPNGCQDDRKHIDTLLKSSCAASFSFSPRLENASQPKKVSSESPSTMSTLVSSSAKGGGTDNSESSVSSAPTVEPSKTAFVLSPSKSVQLGVASAPIKGSRTPPSPERRDASGAYSNPVWPDVPTMGSHTPPLGSNSGRNTPPSQLTRLARGQYAISTSLRREALGMSAGKSNDFQVDMNIKFRQKHMKALEQEERCIIERRVAELVRRAVSRDDIAPPVRTSSISAKKQQLPANSKCEDDKLDDVKEICILPSVNPSPNDVKFEDLNVDGVRRESIVSMEESTESDEKTDWEGVWSAPPAQLLESSIMMSESFEIGEEDLGPCLESSSELLSPLVNLVAERSPGSRLAAALAK